MTRQQVARIVRERWCGERGSKPYLRHNQRAPSREERESAQKALRAHYDSKPRPTPNEWHTRRNELLGIALSYPYHVGYEYLSAFLGPIRTIRGSGYSWEEAARAAKLLS